jgi:energy-coupling factor transporter ATP-binding protein EcfA2
MERIHETANLLHIGHLLKRSPDTLSGGEKRMAGIASILCLKPSILILDEPYANLDRFRHIKSAGRTGKSIAGELLSW